MFLLGKYKNGNYQVELYSDGTKIRSNNLSSFIPTFPESIDFKITNYCDLGCPYCHERSSKEGAHARLDLLFLETLHPYTELAIGGGNPLAHPDIKPFLYRLKKQNIIANITINMQHYNDDYFKTLVKDLIFEKLIYGLGISITSVGEKEIELASKYPNLVFHVINGIIDPVELLRFKNTNAKVLILGYKDYGRGHAYQQSNNIETKCKSMYDLLPILVKTCKVLSFDNLAIKQLEVWRLMSQEKWAEFYMGDDGKFTMYIDGVAECYAKSSVSVKRFELLDHHIDTMFTKIREIS